MARNIRQQALEKIAALSASTSAVSFDRSDLDRLCRAASARSRPNDASNGPPKSRAGALAQVPMNIREFEVLIALCKTAPMVNSSQSAQKLARQLIPYLLESHVQTFAASPAFARIEPSANEAMTSSLTAALLSLGNKHADLHEIVSDNVWSFLEGLRAATRTILPPKSERDVDQNLEDALRTATIAISLLGFIEAASAQAGFWRTGGRLALIQRVRNLLSDTFLTAVDGAFSTIRNAHPSDRNVKDWKRCLRQYASQGRPLGQLLLKRSFMWLLVAATSLLIVDVKDLKNTHVLDVLMSRERLLAPGASNGPDADFQSIELYAGIAREEMERLEADADFLQLGHASQQRLACAVKACAIISVLNCSVLNEDAADPDNLMGWLTESLDSPQIFDENFASVVLRAMAIVSRLSPNYAPTVIRLLPRFIVQTTPPTNIVEVASQCLAFTLKKLSNDAVISTLYTLGNVLSPSSEHGIAGVSNGDMGNDTAGLTNVYHGRQSTGSSISFQVQDEEESTTVYSNIIQTICGIARLCGEEKITALAQAMLLQKLTKVNQFVDAHILTGASILSLNSGQVEFRSLLRLYSRMCHHAVAESHTHILDAVMKARSTISANIKRDSPLFDIYLEYMLEDLVSKGDVHQTSHMRESDIEFAAQEIEQLLQPLAILMSTHDFASTISSQDDDESRALLRDAWFNIVVHGFIPATDRGRKYMKELKIMAIHSPPLVAEQRGEQVESDIELNTVLRRANTSDRESKQKKNLAALMPSKASDIRGLSYRKAIFLQAAYLVETLRADAGDCTQIFSYFLEPSMRKDDVRSVMEGVTSAVLDRYLDKTLHAKSPTFSAHYAASQLAKILCGCCHRIQRVQQAAFACADRFIREVPSSLCQRSSLFAVLELLSLMWLSCFEAETEMYDPRSVFTSKLGHVTVELSDDYMFRKMTLNNLYKKAKQWVSAAINLAPSDVKGLLQTYLSEFDDEGAYGHMSLGRSFAMEMGSAIPTTDQRLTSLNRIGDTSINTASDFIAQYTTRQEYRYGETLPSHGNALVNIMPMVRRNSFVKSAPSEQADAVAALAHVESRLTGKKVTPLQDVRDILRRAAALLCRSQKDESAITHYLVTIPFRIFTKESIKFGVSLWLGVMNENPRMESRLLSEIAQQSEITIQKKQGLFNPTFMHPDPFFLKEEFAPSDQAGLAKRRQQVHNLLSPHTQLMQFFGSHFNATRLGSPDTQRIFLRLLDLTLDALKCSISHPMARGIRLRILLFSLRVLVASENAGAAAQWRLKDKILSAGLSWFKYAPKWSFGSNILQLKTEAQLIRDVKLGLNAVSKVGVQAATVGKYMAQKESLLEILLDSEEARLNVWIHPLNEGHLPRADMMTSHGKAHLETALKPLIRVAWAESPSLAIELVSRFSMPSILHEVRWLLLNFPTKALYDPEALPILFGGELPQDVRFQLKYLLFWAPVNPVTAVTYFLPAYKNHPFLIQYAMRALEDHSVDVTFFYVPQIVQSLRFDALGYVERYINETAQFSQLFAHQIIWNMKANSYKDDDATIPDAIKPALDKVMKKMVDSFSGEDKSFYEREFDFFDEVTSISGKLKPLIKRDKPEKKQKIEEELRKIKVDVGVYLPSNPDGVVIGIDRKSGKPLQSHAKAPYMATFRIQKTEVGVEETEEIAQDISKTGETPQRTIEVWQSAIFKVGDDCRQDVLALQMVAAFRGIFHSVGLDVYVFPYRVTATAPGCGVIDVLPNSISRDMLGREAVNGLYDYFVSKYGNEDSLRFQHARNNFVKSMAAYSIISFLLQFKDRHNGNIMIDDAGHILHIDFGFCFDIAPGGVKFERAPFKLTNEMMLVMGGSTEHQAFKWFEELCVKCFLASRQYAEKLSQIVLLMMESGLPCFKPETVKHFKERFVLEKNEREAAEFVRDLVKKSAGSYSTMVYDQFQLMTNGIPY
ncbi:phosphatidylinositol 3 [Xylariaceae sp. FL1019]|nr:phosphatidylinositol 3 [Xylariaceae sp. FL1019]